MKKTLTVKQRMSLIGQLSFLMNVENKSTYMNIPESMIREYDCSGHFYSSDDVEVLMTRARRCMESDFETFSHIISLIIFILSDTTNI
jgi:hypothetical protein